MNGREAITKQRKANTFFVIAFVIAITSLLLLSVFIYDVSAYSVEVGIYEVIQSEVKVLNRSLENNFIAMDYDVYNTGSTAYTGRLRMDLYKKEGNKTKLDATIWSGGVPLNPGERKSIDLYWYGGNKSGNITAKLSVYRAEEINDAGQFDFELENSTFPQSAFNATKIRVYDDKIRIYLESANDAGNVVIYPVKYPLGWIFEQQKIGRIAGGQKKWVDVYYEPSLFSEKEVTIAFVGDNGKYYSEKSFVLKKEKGFWKYAHKLTDLIF